MHEIDERIVMLLYKQHAGEELEEDEQAVIDAWLAESPHHRALAEELGDEPRLEADIRALMAIDEEGALKKLRQAIAREKGARRRPAVRRLRYAAAAVLLLASGAAAYWLLQPGGHKKPLIPPSYTHDITPGGNKALLELADGSTVALDSVADGVVSRADGVFIRKEKGQRVVYDVAAAGFAPGGQAAPFNTIRTPERGQFEVVLPDSSRVWLNAASRLRYPVGFADSGRVVYLEGEAYFEVTARHTKAGRKIPLKVVILHGGHEQGTVEVLGTRFNINAYADDDTIHTTLVEGSVRLRPAAVAQAPALLRPGQEARLAGNGGVSLVKADVDRAISWKEGFFDFRDTKATDMMHAISRWYGVQVAYADTMTHSFTGRFSRSLPLSKLLALLELTGDVHFLVEGKTVRVSRE